MKKIFLILVISLLLVSACSIIEFPDDTTGNAPLQKTFKKNIVTCTDTDNGIEYFAYGKAKDSNSIKYDYCAPGASSANVQILYEAYCKGGTIGGFADYYRYYCPNGCKDGVCL